MVRKILLAIAVLTTILFTACNGYHPIETITPSASTNISNLPSATVTTNVPIEFIFPTDGSILTLTPDPNGKTIVDVHLQVNIPGVSFIFIDFNGADPLSYDNSNGVPSFEVHFSWQPAHGNGSYQLTASAFGAKKDLLGEVSIQVTVSGTSEIQATPTEAIAPPAFVLAQIKSIFQQQFNLVVPFPAVARKDRSGVTTDPWVSTAWLGNSLYQVYLYPDGHTDAYANPIGSDQVNIAPSGEKILPVCKPAGTYSMLVVFIDYGNLDVSAEEVKSDLQQATNEVNTAYAVYGSILKIQTIGVVIPIPANLPVNGYLTKDMVRALTGFNPADYDWVTQVDLDANNATRLKGGSMEQTSFGYATGTCSPTSTAMDIWVGIDNVNELTGQDGRLLSVLLSHEVFHLFGYPASHLWACTDGKTADPADQCDYRNIPSLLLGWIDTDGDGVAEILDTATPYGTTNP